MDWYGYAELPDQLFYEAFHFEAIAPRYMIEQKLLHPGFLQCLEYLLHQGVDIFSPVFLSHEGGFVDEQVAAVNDFPVNGKGIAGYGEELVLLNSGDGSNALPADELLRPAQGPGKGKPPCSPNERA